jgi:putative membrane protein
MMHGSFGGNAFGFGGNFLGGGMMILIWVLVIGLLAFAFYWIAKRGGKSVLGDQLEDPSRILRARYAKGEITKDEFLLMKSHLE